MWSCRRHPDLQPASLAAIRAVSRPGPQATHELRLVAEALERGALHPWSNG